jgi:hypothetical protein
MEIVNKKGWGAAAPRLKERRAPIPRYGISPQLAPPIATARDRECLNSATVGSPQADFVNGDDPFMPKK